MICFFFFFFVVLKRKRKIWSKFSILGAKEREREEGVGRLHSNNSLSVCVCINFPIIKSLRRRRNVGVESSEHKKTSFFPYIHSSIISNNKKKNKKNPSSYHMQRRRRRRRRQGLFYLFFRRQQQQPWINSFSIIHRDDRTRVGSTIVTSSRGHTGHTARSQKHAAIWWCISNRSLP